MDMSRINSLRSCLFTTICMLSAWAHAQASPVAPGDPAADYKRGQALLWDDRDRSNDAEGIALIRSAADEGHAEAQAYLSTLHEAGIFVERDSEASFRWAEKAAAQKHPGAMVKLAFAHLHGQGVAPDPVKARTLLEEAAGLGDVDAMANLGAMYGRGDGVPRDDVVSSGWYRKAAELGSQHGIWGIANMYARGHGVPEDPGECYFWARQLDPGRYPKAQSMQAYCAGKLSARLKREIDARLEARAKGQGAE